MEIKTRFLGLGGLASRKGQLALVFSCIFISLLGLQGSKAADLPQLKFTQVADQALGRLFFLNDSAADSAYLNELRLKFKLDSLVAGCTTELDKVLVVTNWVNGLWEHNGHNVPRKNDPISILVEVMQEGKQFRCVEYAKVISGCLNSLGITSRILGLRRADVQTREYGAGHLVAEAYLASLDKWVMIDGQANVVPMLNGTPLNAVELQNVLRLQLEGFELASCGVDLDFSKSEYIDFISPYLYYFQTDLALDVNYDVDAPSVMLVPLGACNPVVLQIKYPFVNVSYTHSVTSFYQKPIKY